MENTILDCGHAPSEHGPHTTGYGKDDAGRTFCYACAADKDRNNMRETGRATLYLVKRSDGWHVTNWPNSLDLIPWRVKVSKRGGGFGCQRTDAWFNFEGATWHAINRGDMEIARCRRLKHEHLRSW